ncbi:MAG: Cyclopropane-fatty-acyl-phospholipid synthase-like protein, clusters with FIG005069 [uncultured Paraburkholderia sp.]|nr:MAG: Cyclopropane-fatty-acyl-phospholipid synthase-like protein, clusters with FIG005069 [uncultured Paraburkholderia sp.]CAH2916511.1 MAG: Cyclopropane-fatty-acyl-phospholipid synthase-like protein, clusters with FIG005069 [uncultured Paraburkholderia sp.]
MSGTHYERTANHWLAALDAARERVMPILTDTYGALALFSTSAVTDAPIAWLAPYRALLEEYSQSDPARLQRKADDWESHDIVLDRSPFCVLESVSIVETQRVSAQSLIERPQSMSSLSRNCLGDRLDELLARVQALVDTHATNGWLEDRVESTALIARRPVANPCAGEIF